MSASIEDRFADASAILASARDIVAERATSSAPSWSVRREWQAFLSGLSDEAVIDIERAGLAAALERHPSAPADLVDLARAVRRSTDLPIAYDTSPRMPATKRASPRKHAQVMALAHIASHAAPLATRIVDIGSGHGHLTRHLAATLRVAAMGWERDPDRIAIARSLTAPGGPTFVELDAREAGAALLPTDLVVGLHACGELGDHAVRAVARSGSALVLVGCCLQKREGDRVPLVTPPNIATDALVLSRPMIGLGNARDGEDGIETDLATRSASRERRLALRSLFGEAGLALEPGEEMRGVNRRRATGSLAELADRAFEVRRLASPTPARVAEARRHAAELYPRLRRWELARTMLARLIEVWVALDRAVFLARSGGRVEVVIAFDARESPRNIAVLASG